MNSKFWFLILAVFVVIPAATAQTTDSWSDNGNNLGTSFKWEKASEWSLGVAPSTAQTYVMMTNAIFGMGPFGRTVSIDLVTVLSNAINGCLTINNLTISTPSSHPVELFLNNTGTNALHVVFSLFGENSFLISTNGIVSITNSTLDVDIPRETSLIDQGTLILNTGTISADILINNSGKMTVFDGSVSGELIFIGGDGSLPEAGTLTIGGGTVTEELLDLGAGAIWLTGGTLFTSDSTQLFGTNGGMMAVSNGTWEGSTVLVQGALIIAGGTVDLEQPAINIVPPPARLAVSQVSTSAGAVWMTGGQLTIGPTDNGTIAAIVGAGSVGQMTISNGTWQIDGMILGVSGGQGSLTVAGGTGSVYSNLLIGTPDCVSSGTLTMSAGSLFVTNAAHTSTLDVENGTVMLSGGTLVVDALVKGRPCGKFQQTGGTLVVGGVTSIVSSVFAIGAVGVEGSNLRVTWQTPGGMTNVVQATNGGADGSYNTNFVDLSPQIVIPAGNPVTTNYLDVGGATNVPARYYRVRLVP